MHLQRCNLTRRPRLCRKAEEEWGGNELGAILSLSPCLFSHLHSRMLNCLTHQSSLWSVGGFIRPVILAVKDETPHPTTPPPTPHSHEVLAGQMGEKTGYFDTWNIRLNIQLFSCGGCWRGSAVAQKTCQYQMA